MSDIKLFKFSKDKVLEIPGESAKLERKIQNIIEKNLYELIGVRFLETEYSIDGGRMDTIGIDENFCPVIIEYKRHTNENVINQGLFYLHWLVEHKKNFEWLVLEKMGKEVAEKVDWSAPRVICIAGGFTKYDEHAVREINKNIELIKYVIYGDDLLALELVNSKTADVSFINNTKKHSDSNGYLASDFLNKGSDDLKNRFEDLKNYILTLGDDIQEKELKYYFAFKRIKNFVCVEFRPQRNNLVLFLPLNPDEENIKNIQQFRDVRNIGHGGTGDLEFTISNDKDLELVIPYIDKSYNKS